jgi:uncharacterized protein (TIGR02145 family)
MPDNHYWMAQDLKFGNCDNSNTYWNNDNSEAATKKQPTVYADASTTYVGHCKDKRVSGAGYHYNWPAVMQNPLAYNGSSVSTFACSGSASGTCSSNETCPAKCQGICPSGWHVPTAGELTQLNSLSSQSLFSLLECVPANMINPDGSDHGSSYYMFSSTFYNSGYAERYVGNPTSFEIGTHSYDPKSSGMLVRCVKNY